MFSKLRDRMGTAGLVVAVIALVFAMLGGAYAATSSSKKKFVTKPEAVAIAKQYAGKPGAPGAAGPTGPAGPQGAAGAKGNPGEKGEKGENGKNGKNGENGENGSPWTAGGTLPPSTAKGCPCTETGTWSTGAVNVKKGEFDVPISFPIPLAADLTAPTVLEPTLALQVHYIYKVSGKNTERFVNWSVPELEEVESTACTGSVAEPTAKPKNLCIYEGKNEAFETVAGFGGRPISNSDIRVSPNESAPGASKVGAFLRLNASAESAQAAGSWAVTG
jgi:Collagen triple helix repeat (20 copies)